VKKPKLLDSFALLAYLKKENDFEKVKDAFIWSQKRGQKLLMNDINIGETYYIIARERGLEASDYFLQNILGTLPIKVVSNSYQEVIEAAKIKAQYPISYADAFIVATALREQVPVLTGDPEFKKVEHLIEINWLS
jgi:ribonuclease VapC